MHAMIQRLAFFLGLAVGPALIISAPQSSCAQPTPEAAKTVYPLSIPVPKGSLAPVCEQLEAIARDGTKLVVHRWTPPKVSADKPVVVFLHGIGMHGEPYAAIAAGFTSRQVTLVVPDLRGHGRSGGKRGKMAESAVLRADLGEVIGLVNKRHPEAPIFLAGESMGGLIAADYPIRGERRLAGLILLAPAFKVHDSQLKLAGFDEFLKGRVSLTAEKKLKPSTRDPGFIEARRKDKLALADVESGYLTALGLRQLEWPLASSQLKLPLFIGVAGQEEIINPKVAKAVFDLAATPPEVKTWRQWDEARHTLCWDPLTPQIVEEVTKWLREVK
jgi:alpha-beta hydrolase superfamily lysophospholipase